MATKSLVAFIAESNRIEGITRRPNAAEIRAHETFLDARDLDIELVEKFVETVAGAKLRERKGMDVYVGKRIPPHGGYWVKEQLIDLLIKVNCCDLTAPEAHIKYETLHPFMDGNGRSGRAIWLWQMIHQDHGVDPYGLPFLHRFYYQTLDLAPEHP